MGRLIDADKLLQEIESLSVHITGLRSGKGVLSNFMNEYRNTVVRIIDEQPTAYDPESVADCLEKASTLVQYSKRTCKFAIEQDLAVQIVRNGGAE